MTGTSDENVGNELLSRLLDEHDSLEQQLEHFHHVGRVIGAVYSGIVREGTPDNEALELTANWMECHLFDRIDKHVGTFQTDEDTDEDSEDDE